MKTCSFDGCGKRLYQAGLCRGHYAQRRRGGALRPLRGWITDVSVEGLLALATETRSGCREWNRGRDTNGYGTGATINGRRIRAHVLMWTLANGPVPKGLQVRHSCDNPPCINPAHLLIGTASDNMTDRSARGRNPLAKSTAEQRRIIRQRTDLSICTLAAMFGLARSSVSAIRRGKTYMWERSNCLAKGLR